MSEESVLPLLQFTLILETGVQYVKCKRHVYSIDGNAKKLERLT